MTTLDHELWTLALDRAEATPGPTNLLRDLLWRSLHLSGWRPRAPAGEGAPANTDRVLLERFVHGDPEAFEALVERHGGVLVAFARRSLPDEYADDAIHEAFLALFSRAHEVIARGERNVLGFLFGVARLEVCKSLGQRLREQDLPLPQGLVGDADATLERLRAREPAELVGGLLEACDPLEQEVLLRRLDGRPPAEIAATFELEPGHVRVIEHLAGRKLVTELERKDGA